MAGEGCEYPWRPYARAEHVGGRCAPCMVSVCVVRAARNTWADAAHHAWRACVWCVLRGTRGRTLRTMRGERVCGACCAATSRGPYLCLLRGVCARCVAASFSDFADAGMEVLALTACVLSVCRLDTESSLCGLDAVLRYTYSCSGGARSRRKWRKSGYSCFFSQNVNLKP